MFGKKRPKYHRLMLRIRSVSLERRAVLEAHLQHVLVALIFAGKVKASLQIDYPRQMRPKRLKPTNDFLKLLIGFAEFDQDDVIDHGNFLFSV